MTKSNKTNRRCFLKTSVLAAVSAPTIIPSSVLGQAGKPAPSNRITVGLVGCGGRGVGVMNSFLREPNAQVIATCDPYETHYRGQGKGRALGRKPAAEMVGKKYGSKPCDTYANYRDLCARDDIDVVIVATPDHWHAVQALEALRNGKDIYCEKPVTHFFAEGQALYREVAKRKAIFQTGSQQRSATVFRNAVELVRNGLIGKVKEVQVGLPKGPNKIKGDPIEEDRSGREDYQLWTGPAPVLPYVHARHHQMWRVHLAYGGGQLMDWIGHHNDIARWGLVPSWAKDPSVGNRMFNARAETVTEKPSFRSAFKRRRCLVPIDGFYEWGPAVPGSAGNKQPWLVRRADGDPLVLAGLWESRSEEDSGTLRTCTVITVDANEDMAPIHHRMPALLPPSGWDAWLDPSSDRLKFVEALLFPAPTGLLIRHPVDRRVGNPRNKGAGLLEPVEVGAVVEDPPLWPEESR